MLSLAAPQPAAQLQCLAAVASSGCSCLATLISNTLCTRARAPAASLPPRATVYGDQLSRMPGAHAATAVARALHPAKCRRMRVTDSGQVQGAAALSLSPLLLSSQLCNTRVPRRVRTRRRRALVAVTEAVEQPYRRGACPTVARRGAPRVAFYTQLPGDGWPERDESRGRERSEGRVERSGAEKSLRVCGGAREQGEGSETMGRHVCVCAGVRGAARWEQHQGRVDPHSPWWYQYSVLVS